MAVTGVTGDLIGFKELLNVLNTLGNEKEVNKLLRSSNREALKKVIQAPMKTLPFPASIIKYVKIGAAPVNGARHPNAQVCGFTRDGYKVRFLNTGTAERYGQKGAYKGRIQGKNVIEPMLDSKAPGLLNYINKEYGEDLVKITEKKVKKINRNK